MNRIRRRESIWLQTIAATVLLSNCGGGNDNPEPTENPGIRTDLGRACGAMPGMASSNTFNAIPMPVSASAVPAGGAAIAVEPAFIALSFERPVAMLQAPGDDLCWFVVEQPGRVLAFKNMDDTAETKTFIDIVVRVDDDPNEAGLLGMAFHPDYANNRQVFLSYTGNDGGLTSYVSRFTSADNGISLDPDSEEVILSIAQPYGNHNGGNIAFGPDGYLYIGFGDGGSANDPDENAQNTMNLLGAMLRIDVDSAVPYGIPQGNPFAENDLCHLGFGADDCPEIFAWGLRNPWRWSFDSITGELWAGDVGQSAFEEINIVHRTGNYGWPLFEGTLCNSNAPVPDCSFVSLPPVTEHGRADARSITGGYVYHGSAIPDLVGVFVYADFMTGNIFQYFDPGSGNIIRAQLAADLRVSAFGQANDGELYVLNLFPDGTIHRIVAD